MGPAMSTLCTMLGQCWAGKEGMRSKMVLGTYKFIQYLFWRKPMGSGYRQDVV